MKHTYKLIILLFVFISFSARSQECIKTIADSVSFYTASFSYDGKSIASGSKDLTVKVIDVTSGEI